MADPDDKLADKPALAGADRSSEPWLGRSVPRDQDIALRSDTERSIDDLGVRPGTHYTAFVCSPHGHARIVNIDGARAQKRTGVRAVGTGSDVTRDTRPFTVSVKAPMPHWSLTLQLPGNCLRLKSLPASGGRFGTKPGVLPYIVTLCVAARIAGAPVKWIEDRLERLMAATSAANRQAKLRVAVDVNGRVSTLDWPEDQYASASHHRHLVRTLGRRTIEAAMAWRS